MQEALRLSWRVSPLELPKLWFHCARCDGRRPFVCSGKFRVNAQKKRLDAWLIYRCGACDLTWNFPVFERRAVGDLDPAALDAMSRNMPAAVRRYACDLAGLRRHADRVDLSTEIAVDKRAVGAVSAAPARVEIGIDLAAPCGIRLDRFLARQLGVARGAILSLHRRSLLTVSPDGRHALRQPLRDQQRIVIELDGSDVAAAIRRAVSIASV